MAFLYIDDGSFESEEYENNYIPFDGQDPRCVEKMAALSRTLTSLPPDRKRDLLEKIQAGKSPCDG